MADVICVALTEVQQSRSHAARSLEHTNDIGTSAGGRRNQDGQMVWRPRLGQRNDMIDADRLVELTELLLRDAEVAERDRDLLGREGIRVTPRPPRR